MENFGELMRRLLEIQSGGRQRSPELIAEHERLVDGLQERSGRKATPPGRVILNTTRGDGGHIATSVPYIKSSGTLKV